MRGWVKDPRLEQKTESATTQDLRKRHVRSEVEPINQACQVMLAAFLSHSTPLTSPPQFGLCVFQMTEAISFRLRSR